MTAGIIILFIASVLRGWGILNHRRGPMEAPLIASPLILASVSIVSTIMGLIGAILIGTDTSFWLGIIAFVAFWFLSGIWAPILTVFGL